DHPGARGPLRPTRATTRRTFHSGGRLGVLGLWHGATRPDLRNSRRELLVPFPSCPFLLWPACPASVAAAGAAPALRTRLTPPARPSTDLLPVRNELGSPGARLRGDGSPGFFRAALSVRGTDVNCARLGSASESKSGTASELMK